MQLTARQLNRLELWSAPQAAAGVRLAVLPDVLDAIAAVQLDGAGVDELTVVLPIDAAAIADVLEHRVLRIWEDDARFDEWRITRRERRPDDGTVHLSATPIESFFAVRTAPIAQIVGGLCFYKIDIVGKTPSEILAEWVFPALAADSIAWLAVGVIDQDVPIDVTVDWDTPLALMRKIAAGVGRELQFRRNGTAGYLVDIVTQVGAAAGTVDVRFGQNLREYLLTTDADEQVNRVFPRGADLGDGHRATIARAVWRVANVVGQVITLEDPLGGAGPIAFDDQLGGAGVVDRYLRKADGALTQITAASAANQTVTVVNAVGLVPGQLVQVRANLAGDDLTLLEAPADQAVSGIVTGWPDYPDVPGTNNLIPNPAVREWPGGALPIGWGAIGAPVTSKDTTPGFFRTAPHSLKVDAAADAGVQTPAGPVFPTEQAPYGSGYLEFFLASGQVRVELVVTTPGGPVVLPAAPAQATSTTEHEGYFGPGLGVSGEDLKALGATAVALRILAHGGPAVFYVDRAQVTPTAAQEPFFEGSGGTKLWQLGNDVLRLRGAPLPSFTLRLADFARFAPEYAGAVIPELGAAVNVTDARVHAGTAGSRIAALRIRYLQPEDTELTISNQLEDFSGRLARSRAPRAAVDVVESNPLPGPTLDVNAVPGTISFTIHYTVTADVFEYSIDGTGWASVPASGFTASRPAAGAADRTLTFRALRNGQIVTNTITVPAIDKDTVTPDLTVTQTAQDEDSTSFQATVSNPGGGGAPTLTVTFVNCTGQGYVGAGPHTIASGTVVVVDRPVFSRNQATVTFRAAIAGGGAEEISRTIANQIADPETDVENMVVNGGGQVGADAIPAPGWTNTAGNSAFNDLTATAKFGDRALRIDNTGVAADSQATQDHSVVADGFYELSGWIRTDSINSGAGYGALLALAALSATVVLVDKVGDSPSAGALAVGIAKATGGGTVDYTFVRLSFRCTVSGDIRLILQLGYGGATGGKAWYDGIKLRRVPRLAPELKVWAVEGSTADTIYYQGEYDDIVYRIDNGADAAVPASGFTASRNAAGGAKKVLTFTATRAGQTKTATIEVRPQDVAGAGVTAVVDRIYVSARDYIANQLTIAWAFTGSLNGGEFELIRVRTLNTSPDLSGAETSVGVQVGSSPQSLVDAVPDDIQAAAGPKVTYSYLVRVKDAAGDTISSSNWLHVTESYL